MKKELEKDEKSIVISITKDDNEFLKTEVVSFNTISTINYQLISSTLNSVKSEYALSISDIDKEELAKITTPMSITSTTTNPDLTESGIGRDMVSMAVMMIFIIPMFILIVLFSSNDWC